jgi:two-component system, cell cycle sensor histidine kinase and response regulator CckA
MSSKQNKIESVLLVEDEKSLRQLMAHVLRRHGYMVREADDGREALQVLADPRARVDCIVTDIVMPWLGGPELIEQIRASGNAIPIVCTSGFVTNEGDLPGVLPDVLLAKPFTPRQLLDAVESSADAAERRQSLGGKRK